MKEIKDIVEGNYDDGNGTLDNNEQSQKVGLSEMPVEILEHILVHLDDVSLLRASHVCTLFASVAETAFAQIYSNECYRVLQWSDAKMSFHEVMLSKYGDKIRKLDIDVNEKDKRLLDLAERTCCNLISLDLHDSPKMILSTGLKEARLVRVKNLNRASFTEFIDKNQQLEILRLGSDKVDLLDVLDGLNNLKTLEFKCCFSFANNFPLSTKQMRLNALETLKLDLSKKTHNYDRVLRAITCNELKSLSIFGRFIDLDDTVIDQICSFRTLVSLQLDSFKVTESQLKTLAQQLPNITEFGMGIAKSVEHTIQLALRSLPKLTKLTIELGADDYRNLFDDFKRSIHDFHTVRNLVVKSGDI